MGTVVVRHQSCEVILVIMEYQNWTKVCFLLVSCSAILTECSLHHSSSSYYPSTSLSQTTHTLGNNVYGGQAGQHSYSYTSKGPWGTSYQTEYFPFPSPLPVLPLEDIDLPAGPPAILRPGTRGSAVQLYYPTFQHLGTYLQPSYSQYLL